MQHMAACQMSHLAESKTGCASAKTVLGEMHAA